MLLTSPLVRLLRRLSLSIFIATLVGCGASDLSFDEYLERAKARIEGGNLDAAGIELKNALQANPDSGEARFLLGKVMFHLGYLGAAGKELERSQELGFSDPEQQYWMVRTLAQVQSFDKLGDTIADPLFGLDESTKLTYEARVKAGTGQHKEASALFERAIQADGDNGEARIYFADYLLYLRRAEEADFHLQQAQSSSPNDARTWHIASKSASQRRQPTEAKELAKKALELENEAFSSMTFLKSAILYRLIELELFHREDDAALEHVKLLETDRRNRVRAGHYRAAIALQRGDETTAKSLLREVLAVAPRYAPSLTLISALHLANDEFEQAREFANRLVQDYPDRIPARKLLGEIYFREGNYEATVRVMLPVAERAAVDGNFIARLSDALNHLGDHGRAIQLLESAAQQKPNSRGLNERLALYHFSAGDSAAAVASLEIFAKARPDAVQARLMQALLYLNDGDYDRVLTVADRIEKDMQFDGVPDYLRARVAALQGEDEKAKEYIDKVIAARPNYTPVYTLRAELALRAENLAEAKEWFEKTLSVSANNTNALVGLAYVANANEQTDDALRLLKEATEKDPTALRPKLILAEFYLSRGMHREALAETEKAYALRPKSDLVIATYGAAQIASGNDNKAESILNELSTAGQLDITTGGQLAGIQTRNREFEQAKRTLYRVLERYPRSNFVVGRIAELELYTGKPDKALKALSAWAKVSEVTEESEPRSFPEIRGLAYAMLGQHSESRKHYRKAMQKAPISRTVIGYTRAMRRTGDAKKADDLLNSVLKANPNDLVILAERGLLKYQNRDADGAIKDLQAVRDVRPNLLDVNLTLSLAYGVKGDERAISLAEETTRVYPDSARAVGTYGWILSHSSDRTAEALPLLERAHTLDKSDTTIHYYLSSALSRAGDVDAAKTQLQRLLKSPRQFEMRSEAEALLRRLNLL